MTLPPPQAFVRCMPETAKHTQPNSAADADAACGGIGLGTCSGVLGADAGWRRIEAVGRASTQLMPTGNLGHAAVVGAVTVAVACSGAALVIAAVTSHPV